MKEVAVDELESWNIINWTLLATCADAEAIVSSEKKHYSPLTAESWLLMMMIFSNFACLLAQNLARHDDGDDDGDGDGDCDGDDDSNWCLQIIKKEAPSDTSTQKKQVD